MSKQTMTDEHDDNEPCDYCDGKGFMDGDPMKTCPACGGSGLQKDWITEDDHG